jgi:hypothetical protein
VTKNLQLGPVRRSRFTVRLLRFVLVVRSILIDWHPLVPLTASDVSAGVLTYNPYPYPLRRIDLYEEVCVLHAIPIDIYVCSIRRR